MNLGQIIYGKFIKINYPKQKFEFNFFLTHALIVMCFARKTCYFKHAVNSPLSHIYEKLYIRPGTETVVKALQHKIVNSEFTISYLKQFSFAPNQVL